MTDVDCGWGFWCGFWGICERRGGFESFFCVKRGYEGECGRDRDVIL